MAAAGQGWLAAAGVLWPRRHAFWDARIFGRTNFWTHGFLDARIFGRTDFWTHGFLGARIWELEHPPNQYCRLN